MALGLMIKAIIFDMDGVLYDSQPIHFRSERKTVAHFGGRITDAELTTYLGWNEKAFWEDVIRRCGLKTSVEEIERYERPLVEGMMEREIKRDKKLIGLLTSLRKMGLKLAVASSSNGHLVRLVLRKLGADGHFDTVVAGEDVERSKPEPDIFLAAAKRIGIEPGDCIVVEDAPAGLEAAWRGGMHPVALRGKVNGRLDLTRSEREIAELPELIRILEEMGTI